MRNSLNLSGLSFLATGDLAAGMAGAPLHTDGATADAQVAGQVAGRAGKPGKARTLRGHETRKADKGDKVNPITAVMGQPTFSRPERAIKWFQDKFNQNKQNATIGKVAFDVSGVTIQATVYQERVIEKTTKGRMATNYLRFSLPKGVRLGDDLKPYLGEWSADIMTQWQEWTAKTGNTRIESARAGLVALGSEALDDSDE